jgi:TRAP transporter TAXI family solute receptor
MPIPAATAGKSHTAHALTIWAIILGVCLAALFGTYMLFVEAPPPKKIVIATGGKTGAYYQVAQKYAADLEKEGITLEVRETKGSVENLQLLKDDNSGVSVAIVQSGVADPEDREKFLALGSLYREPLWVFYRGETGKDNIDRLSYFQGKRLGVGNPGSGTRAIALQLLKANELTGKVTQNDDPAAAAAEKLKRGDLDAAFFVAGIDANYIQDLVKDSNIRLLNFSQHEAYHRKFRFLSQVTIPEGLIDLGQNMPRKDINLVAPTAMLVVRKDIHPALIPLLLTTATRVHGQGDQFTSPGEFPSASFTDIPVSEDAKHFYKSGPPALQRMLPFWLAALVDRLKIMLIPLIVLLMPLFRTAPPLVRWRTRRKIYLWYSVLRDIDQKIIMGLSGRQLDAEIARLRDIEHQVAFVAVPLSYMEEFYHLRLHLKMLQEKLEKMRASQGAEVA